MVQFECVVGRVSGVGGEWVGGATKKPCLGQGDSGSWGDGSRPYRCGRLEIIAMRIMGWDMRGLIRASA